MGCRQFCANRLPDERGRPRVSGAQLLQDLNSFDKLLLDTDVLNYIARKEHKLAPKFRPFVHGKILAISFITVAEIYFGIFNKMEFYVKWKDFWTKRVFPNLVILYPDYRTCEIFGKLRAEDKKQVPHRNTFYPDLWIAACAIQFELPLLTNNIKHFQHIKNLKLVSIN